MGNSAAMEFRGVAYDKNRYPADTGQTSFAVCETREPI
jgi:hypothetical protein